MALIDGETASTAASGFSHLPISRQIGLLVGLAASIAVGIAVVFWSMEPNYRPLFSSLNSRDASEVIDVLQSSGIKYKINKNHGVVMVPSDEVYGARLKLAAEGLPRNAGTNPSIFSDKNMFGNSQFMEAARYRHAVADELAETITNFNNIKSARVHLAIPKQTSFVRGKRKPSASVFVDIYAGRQLSPSQIASIVHLVASSIPELEANDVTVVDQNGTLLTDGSSNEHMRAANQILNYRQQVENSYTTKIQGILTPLLGPGKVKARVTADIDFSALQQTRESYDPDMAALRSEQKIQESRRNGGTAGGVPGALSNKPPPKPTAARVGEQIATGATATSSGDSRLQFTKNYELDRTVSHSSQQPGRIRRLNVAVVVDDKTKVDKAGKITRTPLTAEEMTRIKTLVENAIGYNKERGDSVDVVNSSFAQPEPVEKLPEPGLLDQAWFWQVVKQVLGGLFVLLMIFGVLRPILRSLSKAAPPQSLMGAGQMAIGPNGEPIQAAGADGLSLPSPLQTYEDKMNVVQNMAGNDPKRVAQVVKTWVDSG